MTITYGFDVIGRPKDPLISIFSHHRNGREEAGRGEE